MMNVMKLQVPTTTMFDFVDSVTGTAAGTVLQTVVEVNLAVPDCTTDSWVFVWVHLVEGFRVAHRRAVFRVVNRRRFHLRLLRANVTSVVGDLGHATNGGARWTTPTSILRSL